MNNEVKKPGKRQRPAFRDKGRRARLPRAPAQKKRTQYPNALVLQLDSEAPPEDAPNIWAIDDGAGEYEKLGAEIGRLVEQKQAAYGDAFGKSGEVLRILYPTGIPPEKLDDAAAIIRVLDKLFRIATDRDALGESPWRDIAGYALLGAARAERKR